MRNLPDLVGVRDVEDDGPRASVLAVRARGLARARRDDRVLLVPRRRIVVVVERNTPESHLPMAPPVDSAAWREALLVVRYHARGAFFGALRILAQTVSQTRDEPAVLFEAEKAATDVVITSGTPFPRLFVEPFTPGPAVRVALVIEPGTGTAGVGTLDVTLSIELVGHRQ